MLRLWYSQGWFIRGWHDMTHVHHVHWSHHDGWAQIHEMKQVSATRANCILGHLKMFLDNNVNLGVSINGVSQNG